MRSTVKQYGDFMQFTIVDMNTYKEKAAKIRLPADIKAGLVFEDPATGEIFILPRNVAITGAMAAKFLDDVEYGKIEPVGAEDNGPVKHEEL